MLKPAFVKNPPSQIQPAPVEMLSLNPQILISLTMTQWLLVGVLTIVGMILGTGIGWSAIDTSNIPRMAGESATLLPDGAILLLGGEGEVGIRQDARIWHPQAQEMTVLSSSLQVARAWHSATMMPDGTVLIIGGMGATGQLVNEVEAFDPETRTFEILSDVSLTPRAYHTATLLTEGRVLIAGGRSDTQEVLDHVELWDPQTSTTEVVAPGLNLPRSHHSASLQPDGRGLLLGGRDSMGVEPALHDAFDPDRRAFTLTQEDPDPLTLPILLETSNPIDGTRNVPLDQLIAVRLSRPVHLWTVTSDTITLETAEGRIPLKIVPTEEGQLLFFTPLAELHPESAYTVRLDGVQDTDGNWLVPATITFVTETDGKTASEESGQEEISQATATAPGARPVASKSSSQGDPVSAEAARYSPWRNLPPLQAPPGVTALSGQVFTLNGQPLAKVRLLMRSQETTKVVTTTTDGTGRFLLTDVPERWGQLIIDGRHAGTPGRTYGVFEVGAQTHPRKTTHLAYPIWMPALDQAHAVQITSPTTGNTVVTSPHLPGLELHIPAGTRIQNHEWQPVAQVSITAIPLDRPPFPLPAGVEVPIYFTIQPGAAYLRHPEGKGARLIYPNLQKSPPGTRYEFWNYDPEGRGWYRYGNGTVTADGRQIVPDPGVVIYKFTGAMVGNPGFAPGSGPPPGSPGGTDGDPVDLFTGLFVLTKTDLTIGDVIPITLSRTYRTQDTRSRSFGIGATHQYDMFLIGDTFPYTFIDLILPDGGRVHYDRISPGTSFSDAVYEHTATPTAFYESRIEWKGLPIGWELTRQDGTVFQFPDGFNATNPSEAALVEIRTRTGNRLTLSRESNGNLTTVTAPSGRRLTFSYDGTNRITSATDHTGRTVGYTYNAQGYLWKVMDAEGGVTTYTYDGAGRLQTIKDARGLVFLTNEYDSKDRVIRQIQADNSEYQFTYIEDAGGAVIQTNVPDPRGFVRQVTFNAQGYMLTDTRAVGQPEEQMTLYTLQSGTNFRLAMNDPLGRETSWTYDSLGNILSETRLAGTPEAVTTTFTYEPNFQQLASVTDPLQHTITVTYDSKGNPLTITDPLQHQTTLSYNIESQLVEMMDAEGAQTAFTYEGTDLVGVTDPLGRLTTRFTDDLGRVLQVTNPRGESIQFDYNALNILTQVTDALGATTSFTHDENGNRLTLTDANTNPTSFTYDTMDRPATRTDALTNGASFQYDAAGNPTQVTDRKGQVTTFTYDALNRRTQVTYDDTSTTSYTYDAGNRLVQIVDSLSGTITRTYDDLNRLTAETTPQGSVSYTYDAANRRTSMTVNGQYPITYTYDTANRLTQMTQDSQTISYTYDDVNRRSTATLPNGILVTYGYDAASQLTDLTYTQGMTTLGTLTYQYDAAGHRTTVGGTWARTGLPPAESTWTYNAANQLTTRDQTTVTYDANGDLIQTSGQGTTVTYTWNARHQLVGISGGGTTASFAYDGLGRRISKTVNSVTTDFLYEGLNPIQELSGGSPVATLLTGLGIDEFISRTEGGTTSTFLTDGLGSTLALTDGTGTVQTEYTYEPFGMAAVTGTNSTNSYQFTGRENDGTGLLYYRARYYSPVIQRFISEDPIGFTAGDQNLYRYVFDNPINFVDPDGKAPAPVIMFDPGPGGRAGGSMSAGFEYNPFQPNGEVSGTDLVNGYYTAEVMRAGGNLWKGTNKAWNNASDLFNKSTPNFPTKEIICPGGGFICEQRDKSNGGGPGGPSGPGGGGPGGPGGPGGGGTGSDGGRGKN